MKTNQKIELFGGKKNENVVTLTLGGRGRCEAAGEGELNEKFPKNTPSSVLWTPSPSRVEGRSGFTRHSSFPSPRRTGGIGNIGAALYPRQRHLGMTVFLKEEALNRNTFRTPLRSGFTLIELLVVVLIIGILASVALPQYNTAVEKSRAANVWPLLKAINEAEQRKNLEEGTATHVYSLEDLDLDFGNFKDGQSSAKNGAISVIHKNSYLSTADFDIGVNSSANSQEPAIAVRKRDADIYALALQNGKKVCIPFVDSIYAVGNSAAVCKKIVGKNTGSSCLTGSNCYTE